MQIGISRLHFPVTTLGPGCRVGIWLQGCSIRCAGCISADTWGFGRGQSTVSSVLSTIRPWIEQADGVTISGGEPFDQPEALSELLRTLRGNGVQDVLVYSGYPIEKLGNKLQHLSGLIDALITDPFEVDAPQTLALRGSDNQRLHLLTKLGRQKFENYDRPIDSTDQVLDLMFSEDGAVWLAGIPQRGDMWRLQRFLREQGHSMQTTEAVVRKKVLS